MTSLMPAQVKDSDKKGKKNGISEYLREHGKYFCLGMIILMIILVVAIVSPFFLEKNRVSCEELMNYIEEYLSEYTRLVDEYFVLLSSYQMDLSNFSFYWNQPNEIEGVISHTRGAAVFFNFSEEKTVRVTIRKIPEPIEYYLWPGMPMNTSDLKWILVKSGDYHFTNPVIYDYGLIYFEPGTNVRYTGEGKVFKISGYGAVAIYGCLIHENRMILKGTNNKEDWSKTQARFDALSEFIWDCKGVLNGTTIEKINAEQKLHLMLEKIGLRMESSRYTDNPSLFREDYEELSEVCRSNETLSNILNDYYEKQKTTPTSWGERFLDFLVTHIDSIITGIIIAVISAIIVRVLIRKYIRPRKHRGFSNNETFISNGVSVAVATCELRQFLLLVVNSWLIG